MKETYPVPYPVMYKNVYKFDDMKRSEHMAVRDAVGWYLWTHQLVEVTGKDAAAFLDYIFPKNISNLKNGRERYTTMLDENAQIIDDVVVFRMEDEKFWISTLFKMMMFPWFEAHKGSYQVEFKDITKEWEMYAVQGPRSIEMVNALVKNPVDNQKFFEMKANEIDGIPVYVNRAGFTGEKLGYELYFPKAEAPAQEEKLRALAPNFGGRLNYRSWPGRCPMRPASTICVTCATPIPTKWAWRTASILTRISSARKP